MDSFFQLESGIGFIDMLLDFLFPRVCVGCGKKGEYLCSECEKELYSHPEICPFCHQKSLDFQTCKSCAEGLGNEL